MVDTAVERCGRLDMAVNNAGIARGFVPIHELTGELLDQQMNVNVKGVMFGMKHQIPAMKASGGGAVSQHQLHGRHRRRAQDRRLRRLSKHAVTRLTRTAAVESGRKNIPRQRHLPVLHPHAHAGR